MPNRAPSCLGEEVNQKEGVDGGFEGERKGTKAYLFVSVPCYHRWSASSTSSRFVTYTFCCLSSSYCSLHDGEYGDL